MVYLLSNYPTTAHYHAVHNVEGCNSWLMPSTFTSFSFSLHHLLALFLLLTVVLPLAFLWLVSLLVNTTSTSTSITMTAGAGNKILGYIIFHRHGHRAPAKNVLSASFDKAVASQEELSLWSKLMPSESLLRRITSSFELDIHDENPIEPDRLNFPFGAITSKGINHLIAVGEKIGKKFPLIKKAHQVDIVATNYQRTQLSVQAMLTGLGLEDISDRGMKVKVRDIQQCAMSFYEGNPQLATKLFKDTQALQDFQKLEEPMASISKMLLNEFPLMARKDNHSRIDWLAAFDYFACRDAHNLPIPHTLDNNDTNASHYGNLIKEHMARRVSMYLASGGEHIRLVAGPLLRDMRHSTQQIIASADVDAEVGNMNEPQDQKNQSVNVHIYSGHDVNILGLLYALEADPQLVSPPFWPDYGSNVIIEVLQQGKLNLYYETEPLKIRNRNVNSNSNSGVSSLSSLDESDTSTTVSSITTKDLNKIMDMVFLGEDEHQRVLLEHRVTTDEL